MFRSLLKLSRVDRVSTGYDVRVKPSRRDLMGAK